MIPSETEIVLDLRHENNFHSSVGWIASSRKSYYNIFHLLGTIDHVSLSICIAVGWNVDKLIIRLTENGNQGAQNWPSSGIKVGDESALDAVTVTLTLADEVWSLACT